MSHTAPPPWQFVKAHSECVFVSVCVQASLSCLLDLLLVLESPPSSLAPLSRPRTAGRHDDVLRLVLTNMEAEHKVALRRVYAAVLPLYIDR